MSKKPRIGPKCIVCPDYVIKAEESFVKCQICKLSIHKSCYNLTGDLLKIYEDYEKKSVPFPIPIICKICIDRMSNKKSNEMVPVPTALSNEIMIIEKNEDFFYKGKHPFEIDNVVEVILNNLSLGEVIKCRLINTFCNKNAVKILSKPENQSQLKPMEILDEKRSFRKMLKNSVNPKLFRNLDLNYQGVEFNGKLDILDDLKPLEVQFLGADAKYYSYNYLKFIIEAFIKISKDVNKIEIEGCFLAVFEKMNDFRNILNSELVKDLQFPQLKELNLENVEALGLRRVVKSEEKLQEFTKLCTKNSPQLSRATIPYFNCSQSFSPNVVLQKLEISSFDFKNLDELLKLDKIRLKTFKISVTYDKSKCTLEEHRQNFEKFQNFLQSQSSTLEKLALTVEFEDLFSIESEPHSMKIILPKLEKLTSLTIEVLNNLASFRGKAWPINCKGSFPKLRKIRFYNHKNWIKSFPNTDDCETVREMQFDSWHGTSISAIKEKFPKIEQISILPNEDLNLFADNLELFHWEETLKKIKIYMNFDQLHEFKFDKFKRLQKLSELEIYAEKVSNKQKYRIEPDFSPLLNLKKLSTISLQGFKICDDILRELDENYLKFTYEI